MRNVSENSEELENYMESLISAIRDYLDIKRHFFYIFMFLQ